MRFMAAAVAMLTAMLVTGAGVRQAMHADRTPALLTEGIAASPCAPQHVIIVPAHRAARYDDDTSVLLTSSGSPAGGSGGASPASACTSADMAASRAWLAAGTVPGMNPASRSMAQRALLDLYLSTRPDGAVVAGWYAGWDYAWPRDSSWVAAALAVTGHDADAVRVLTFLQHEQSRDGTWAARYQADGSGPVRDGRPAELDAVGWVPWAVWSWYQVTHQTVAHQASARRELSALWPMVSAAAGAAERSLSPGGLPGAATDYWEHGTQVTLGTAAPLLTGLRAAAAIASTLGRAQPAQRWADDSARLASAIRASFGCYGYNRLPDDASGPDASITFLGPPFGPGTVALDRAEDAAERGLTLPGGGMLPGTDWPGNTTMAWTAETAFFALFDVSIGENARAGTLLSWLAAHRTPLGALPEQVTAAGQPASVAPLAWTDAAVLLALSAQAHPLPVTPVPPGGQPAAAGGCLLPPLSVVGR